jgi:adenylate cyclase
MNVDKAAVAVGEGAETLRDWVAQGVVPEYTGEWTRAAIGKARLVKRILERGYSLEQVREATEQGRLLSGQLVELFGVGDETYSKAHVAKELGLDPSVVDRVAAMLGVGAGAELGEPDRHLLRYIAKALEVGLPLEAMLQLARVYVRAISQIADAEVRLVHLYVHEPLMRSGASAEALSQEMLTLTEDLLPLAGTLMDHLHWRMLSHFIEQDIVGHMEMEISPDDGDVGLMLVAIAFADLAGYTQLTEREGDLHALDVVDRFLHEVDTTLPDHARVVKTIGDEVMIVGPDPDALTRWAVALRGRGEGGGGAQQPPLAPQTPPAHGSPSTTATPGTATATTTAVRSTSRPAYRRSPVPVRCWSPGRSWRPRVPGCASSRAPTCSCVDSPTPPRSSWRPRRQRPAGERFLGRRRR